jgi:rhamnogalacturonan endolyase
MLYHTSSDFHSLNQQKTSMKKTPRMKSTVLTSGLAALALLLLPEQSHAAFGVVNSGGFYTVDVGANVVFKIRQTDGSMTSCKYKGVELNDQSKFSQIASGLGSATVTATTSGNFITIKCVSSNTSVVPTPLTHYYIAQNGFDNIYMATYVTSEPSVGELRYIFRGQYNVIPNGPPASNNNGNSGAIESSDVFGHSNGQTTSKYFGNEQERNLTVKGATGNGVGVFMAFGNRESSSGGPFYHDIENQGDGAGSDQEIYNYMNSGHNQTEANRINVLHGPYAYCFTAGTTPSVPDMSFIANLGLTGYVNSAGRGRLVLNGIAGRDLNYTYTVGFANSTAQYWVTASASNGSCECFNMKPGTYAMTIYKGELAVWTGSATITAGNPTTFNTITVTGDPSTTSTIWRIGNWDGTPLEFLNGSLMNSMHPSDVRMTRLLPTTFTVGSSSTGSFPSVQYRGTNSPTTVKFNLTSTQAAAAHTLKIGITDAYNNGRPSVVINGHALSNPGASSQPNSRSFTVGSYRGNNTTFSYSIPSADFISGQNTMTVTPISGSSDLSPWLSAAFSYDCVELDN